MEVVVPARPDIWGWAGVVLVFGAVLAAAFNDLYPLLPAGELSSDGFIYVFPLLLLYLMRRPGEITAPVSLSLLILALAFVLLLGVVVNYGAISSAYFKGRSGIGRIATQGLAVGFGLLVTLAFYNLTLRGFLPVISRACRVAILIMAGVGMLEFASWYGIPLLSQIHTALNHVIHAGSADAGIYAHRLRMTAFEVSWAGVMLTFFFPFAIMDLPARGWRLPGYVALVLVLAVMAQSRTALMIIGFQTVLLLAMLSRRRLDLVVHGLAVGSLGVLLLLLAPAVQDKAADTLGNMVKYGSLSAPEAAPGDENFSNVTRLAAIRAGVSMFREAPLLGLGLGQYGFNYPGHLRAEDFRSWEVRKYVTDADPDWPPTYSMHVRLLSETGLLGYIIWLGMIVPRLIRSTLNADVVTDLGRAHLAVAMTLAGWLLLGTSIDSFRFFGGWIAVGVAFALPVGARVMERRLAP